ncbi:MAG: hypothetical protein J07HX5_00573, partial [halophilic archaeon J07HX5]
MLPAPRTEEPRSGSELRLEPIEMSAASAAS